MRIDDPSALKDIVQLVQDHAAQLKGDMRYGVEVGGVDKSANANDKSSRTKFMVETLVNLKNGKAKRGPDAEGAGARDVVERMKKFLGGLSKKRQGWIISSVQHIA
jgi:nucleolar MIF4G domain-containing protein 1